MSVGFALLSSELEVEATGTIAGDWSVKFKSGTLEQTNKTDGVSDVTAELDTNGLKVTLNATFAKPGDSVSYRVVVENTGTINALLKDVRAVGSDANTSAIQLAYTVNNKAETTVYAKGTVVGKTLTEEQEPTAAATIVKKNGETIDNNYLDITLEYLETKLPEAPYHKEFVDYKEVKFNLTKTAESVYADFEVNPKDGKVSVELPLDEFDSGNYTLIITEFVGTAKADQDLPIKGYWECKFEL